MKKKLFLVSLMVVMLVCAFALAISAADVYRTERTYNYYESEIADGNLLFQAKTIYAYDNNNSGKYRFEVITSSSGVGFAKYDADGKPLTWYVVSDSHVAGSDYDDSESYVRNIVVASAKTTDVGSIDANGLYTYNDGYDSKKIVSANFFGLKVKSLPDGLYMATASKTPNGNTTEYCKMADGSYLLALYLPETLTSIPKNLCSRAPIITLEFENNKVSYTNFGPSNSGMYSFAFCANLKSLIIPEGITEVREKDFREAISIEYLKYSSTVKTSANNAFFRGGVPETVVLGENMTFAGYLDAEPYRFYVDTKEAGIIAKYFYVPTTINKSGSKFASYRGGVVNGTGPLSTANNRLVFFFVGTLDEARAIGAYINDDQYIMTYSSAKAAEKGCTYYEPISYDEYIKNKEHYDNDLTGNLLVYNTPSCIAFYDGQHANEEGMIMTDYLSEFKIGTLCSRCGAGEYKTYAPVFEPLGYSLQIGGDKICLGYSVNAESLAQFPNLIYGAVVVIPDGNVANLEPINPDGSLAAERAAHYIVEKEYRAFEFILKSFSKDDAYYSLPIVMCAFVSNGEDVDYLCIDKEGNILQQEYASVTSFDEIYESTKYTVTFGVADANMGSIEGNATQRVGDGAVSEAVTAVPKAGYQFVCWSNGSTEQTITVSPSKNTDLIAYFTPASTGLPVMTINTNGVGITTKEYYIDCEITILDTETGKSIAAEPAEIKGRGNSTWETFDKKPYKFKFESKQNLFGYGKEKTWVLLADARDYSLVRNMLAYNTALSLSELGYTSKGQHVELYLNGEYRGVYYLCEQIQVKDNRVNITQEDSDIYQAPEELGYLVEMDAWADDGENKNLPNYTKDGDVFVTITGGQKSFVIKDPEDVFFVDGEFNAEKAEPYLNYIKGYLQECHDAMYAAKTEENYAKVCQLIDVKSFAQAYIIFDLFKNPDVNYSSVYYYKDAGGKLVCSPVWDFDMSVGNVTHKENHTGWQIFSDTTRLWTKERNYWFNQLLQYPQFAELVGQELEANAQTIRETIKANLKYARAHKAAYEKNFTKWNLIGNTSASERMGAWSVPTLFKEFTTWEAHLDYIENYLEESLSYLESVYVTAAE